MLVRRAERVDAECVVRGYLAGSGWAEYQRPGTVCGIALPDGLREADRLPEPIFTPSTKAEVGHDENISREQLADLVGADLARQLEERSIALYLEGARRAEAVGIILADTKFEFGFIDGELAVIDEVLTPDSSRFWDGSRVRAGPSPPSFDKQFVRDFVADCGLEQGAAAPTLPGRGDRRDPRSVRRRVRAHHRAGLGGSLTVRWTAEVHVALRGGIADPEGQTIASALRSLGYRLGGGGPQRQAAADRLLGADATRRPRRRWPRCAPACWRTR